MSGSPVLTRGVELFGEVAHGVFFFGAYLEGEIPNQRDTFFSFLGGGGIEWGGKREGGVVVVNERLKNEKIEKTCFSSLLVFDLGYIQEIKLKL